jgi:hypothetical protein
LELSAFLGNGGAPPNDDVQDDNVVNRAPTSISDGGGGRSYHNCRLSFMLATMVRKKTLCSPFWFFFIALAGYQKKKKRQERGKERERKKKDKEGEGPL